MTKRKKHGQVTQHDTPHWEPLLKLLAEYLVADFMWMHEVEFKDGTRHWADFGGVENGE